MAKVEGFLLGQSRPVTLRQIMAGARVSERAAVDELIHLREANRVRRCGANPVVYIHEDVVRKNDEHARRIGISPAGSGL